MTVDPSRSPVPAPGGALRTADEVRSAAQLLAKAADVYDARLKVEAPNLPSGEAFARLQDEQRLRGLANQLLYEASQRTLAAAVDDQQALEATLAAAGTRLAAIAGFERVIELVADLAVLGGAIVAGKPAPILAALNEVRQDLAGEPLLGTSAAGSRRGASA